MTHCYHKWALSPQHCKIQFPQDCDSSLSADIAAVCYRPADAVASAHCVCIGGPWTPAECALAQAHSSAHRRAMRGLCARCLGRRGWCRVRSPQSRKVVPQ